MDSKVGQLKRLLNQGETFTFTNFSIRDADGRQEYGGEDSPEWLAWKTRVSNTIRNAMDDNSAPVTLLMRAMVMPSRGYLEANFS